MLPPDPKSQDKLKNAMECIAKQQAELAITRLPLRTPAYSFSPTCHPDSPSEEINVAFTKFLEEETKAGGDVSDAVKLFVLPSDALLNILHYANSNTDYRTYSTTLDVPNLSVLRLAGKMDVLEEGTRVA